MHRRHQPTVADVGENYFQVSVIPHTGEETILLDKNPGDSVNLETDVIGKYVEKLLGLSSNAENSGMAAGSNITMEFLMENGF